MNGRSEDETVHRLYRVRKTLTQMLKDRGYFVSDKDINMSEQQFIDKYGPDVKREDLVMTKSSLTSSEQIFVFFPEEPRVGVQTIKTFASRMKSENVFRAIMVVQQNLSSFARAHLIAIASHFHLEVFQEAELLINVKDHVLVPEHQVLSDVDKKNLLAQYTVKETQLPRIQVTDPVARYYGLKRGQVVRIIRSSETAGRYITYRYCI